MRFIAATLALAFIPAASFAADLPTLKPDIHEQVLPYQVTPAQQPYCHSLFPAPFTELWACDPFHLGDGTTDRSVSHPPGVRPSPPSNPSPPDDGCGDKGDKGRTRGR